MKGEEFAIQNKPSGKRSILLSYREGIFDLKNHGYSNLQICEWLVTENVVISIESVRKFLLKQKYSKCPQISSVTTAEAECSDAAEEISVSGNSESAEPDNDSSHNQSLKHEFYAMQRPLIHLIEEFLLAHPVDGTRMTVKGFCELSGVQPATMSSILNGNRWVAKCGRDTIERLAAILGIPVLQIYIMSGFIQTSDLIYSANVESTLDKIYSDMVKYKGLTHCVPVERVWKTWPTSAKLSLCMVYEQLTETVLFRYASG